MYGFPYLVGSVKDYYKITRLSNLKVPRIGMSTDTFIL